MGYEVFKLYSEQLKREARVFVYLPKHYHFKDKHYPVLYMHDGHNLFDDNTATYGTSWGFIEAYEKNELPELIIVGIDSNEGDNGQNRLDEYSPWQNESIQTIYPDSIKRIVGGNGDDYLDFLVNNVKPLIEKRYRVEKDPKLTGIAGSSMGGLISLYALGKYPDQFSRCACLSNAFWFAMDELKEYILKTDFSHVYRLYMDVGTDEVSRSNQEKDFYVKTNDEIYKFLSVKISEERMLYSIIEEGKHNEADWHKRIPDFLTFIYNDILE